ncbi:glycoside hydrolase family 97 catalytic domain-containing protein [Jiangella alkaliphila]|uniref:Glycosyl-hydrolase 97 C-terminal, oligomerisation n=1 Tax=Jiangella alkaliphila TaxID=419479 RepID=A0A1H2KHJ5_9ACTN|nr:glycoside hydrolase family 97 catalytic domain-containing protein [Jiangella alkaliphila]SDU67891.1 Glycosyl-hydrolase 97 C-terminal, oligomerisation [Jiangella alkaliphila]
MSESTTWSVSHGGNTVAVTWFRGRLTWTALHDGVQVTPPAPLHLRLADGRDLLSGATYVSDAIRDVAEEYDLVVGKRVGRHAVDHRERTVQFTCVDGGEVAVVLRAAPDGVALRFVLSGLDGATVTGGDVDLRFPATAAVWPLTYTPWYETTRFTSTLDALEPGDYGFPFLVELADDTFALVTEADLDGRYGGSFARYAGGGAVTVTLAADVELSGDAVATPWRVVIVGDLATVVGSHLVDDLAPAVAGGTVPEWARPGRAAWSWWSDFYSGAQLSKQRRMLDYAAARGWEYVLVDCGWDGVWMPELVAEASERGVGVFVWVVWDQLATPEQRRKLAEWASWGVAGVKVDFMESEAQERYRWYDEVIAECARVGLMINFHGSVIPRGWARTYPHVMSYEAVRGAEYYVFYSEPLTPEHNTIVPFTRNVVGSADYTPVTFSAAARLTTEAHELALAVVLESGLLNFADDVDEYAKRPIAEAAIERIKAAWDETRLLAGRPGEYVVLARRSGAEWSVGALSALAEPKTVAVDLTVLGLNDGEYAATIITDDAADRLTQAARAVTAADSVEVTLRPNGGALVLLAPAAPAAAEPEPESEAGPRPAVTVADPIVRGVPGEPVEIAAVVTGAEPHLVVPPGWDQPRPIRDGAWSVTVPAGTEPGHVAVLAVHAGDPLGPRRSALAHVRVVSPLGAEPASLVALTPVAAANGSGPVERDMSNGEGNPADGRPMSVAGVHHPRGLGVCAPSDVTWVLDGVAARLTASVGVDDESPAGTTATCAVVGDGRVLSTVEVAYGEPARELDVDVTGITRLRLVVRPPAAGAEPAHVDWIDPHVRPLI